MSLILLLVGLIVFAAMGVPLCFALGATSLLYILIYQPDFVVMLPPRIWSGADSFVMIAMPLFILAGEIMNKGGITKRIIDFCMYLVKPIRGGLGEVNVVASMIFGGISGSSVADTSALGGVLIPEMESRGYSKKFAAGITVASSTMGMIIPPSVPMIMYSMVSGESVGALFMAGLIPGLLIGLSQIFVCFGISRKRGYHPKRTPVVWKDFFRTMVDSLPSIILPFVLVGCISFGVSTATEAAAIAVLYAFILGKFVYKELKWEEIWSALKKTFLTSSSIMIIIGFTTIFTWLLTMLHVPMMIADFVTMLNLSAIGVLILFGIILLILGTFIDVTPCILLVTPIMLPILQSYGVSGLQLGTLIITAMAIGLVTPPVGMCLNACTKVNKMSILEIFSGAIPFVACNIVVLLLIIFFPQVSTWLPQLIGG